LEFFSKDPGDANFDRPAMPMNFIGHPPKDLVIFNRHRSMMTIRIYFMEDHP
jgi:hypothetical protein